MGFNFSEEEIGNMYGMYESALNEIQEGTKGIAEQLTEIAKELKYEPVVKLSVEAVDYYNEELKQTVVRALNEWQNGDLSFSRVMEKMSAGESAKSRSKELEGRIEEGISSWRTVDAGQLSGIDTTNWRCELEDFENIKDTVGRFVETLEEMQNQYANNLESQKEENEIYISIEPVILQTISIVAEGFKAGISESFSSLAQEFESRANEVKSLGAGAAQTAASKSQSFVSSGAAALKAKVKLILD